MERLLPYVVFLLVIAGFTIGLCAEEGTRSWGYALRAEIDPPLLRMPIVIHLEDGTPVTLKYDTATPTERALIKCIVQQWASDENFRRLMMGQQDMMLKTIEELKANHDRQEDLYKAIEQAGDRR